MIDALWHEYIIPFDSNVFVQESRKGWPERGWNGEHLRVILSAAKDLVAQRVRSFAALRMTLVADASLLA